MPCLNADILFEIGKKIVEDGNEDDVYRFALSGKEPLNAMMKVFASATSLELCENYYGIGWGKKVCRFNFETKKPRWKSLVKQIGNRVVDLYVDCIISLNKNWLKAFFKKTFGHHNTVYCKILDRIIAKKQLISFSGGENCGQKFFDQFLPKFSATLKNVSIPCGKMSDTFRDLDLNLDKLTVLRNTYFLSLKNCCKTKSLEVYDSVSILVYLGIEGISPHFSSVKELIINESEFNSFQLFLWGILKFFPSVEKVRFNYSPESPVREFVIKLIVQYCAFFVTTATKVPSNVTFSLNYAELDTTLSDILTLCDGMNMKYDESITEYYCFRKILQDDGVHINVEYQIHS